MPLSIFSDVVVSDFDPFSDRRVLDILFFRTQESLESIANSLTRSFPSLMMMPKRNDPESYLDLESSIEKHISANPEHTADAKAKAAQYFTILNRIEYVITLDDKYKGPQLFSPSSVYLTASTISLHRTDDVKDPIEVYFDNQLGIIEVEPYENQAQEKAITDSCYRQWQLQGSSVLTSWQSLKPVNEQEDLKAERIKEFEGKIQGLVLNTSGTPLKVSA